ncbi:hypothetical protein GSI_14696 [Ganoderma sinense ZZ0214-1]|uniref:F-box domain-containing protein n=1 Tax=Ganoderma sinense ZZ0214-1 TaxID=1077348 RepID=A0A2G8RPD5_9APHY|nr:hypothetical protein GSI_14696 [Ganoderma sinense ZZ0214-1]
MRDPTDCAVPPELELIVLNHLLADKPALASCSLVCSRWLPPTRKHLFREITLKPTMRLNPTPFESFLRTLEIAEETNPEWAIGSCIEKLTIDGSVWKGRLTPSPMLTCSLSFLRRLLSKLPQLASLRAKLLLMPNDIVERPYADQAALNNFKLDKLVVVDCTAKGHDPHHLLALISMFSSIDSLSIINWGGYMQHPISEFSLSSLSPPLVRSLAIEWVSPGVAPAIYALFANSPSVTAGHLAHIYLDASKNSELLEFAGFARIAGAAFRQVDLRANSELFSADHLLDDVSLVNCSALRSLMLCMEPTFDDHASFGDRHARNTREVLSAYALFFQLHRAALPMLTTVRFEMKPIVWMLDAFVRVARDTFPEWPSKAITMVSAEEAEMNRALWEFLEDALGSFPALERVEFVLYERGQEALTEEAKDHLRSALEGRLPELWSRGVAHLVFETFVFRPR